MNSLGNEGTVVPIGGKVHFSEKKLCTDYSLKIFT
jgi:hypothetical protein